MSQQTLVNEIGEWLIDQALSQPDIVEMFEQVCFRLHAVGIPVARARLTWPTLHPLFQAETVLWKRNQEIEFEQFNHQDEASEEWYKSPMHYMFTHDVNELRRNLDGPNKMVDFPVLEDLIEQGLTDYLTIATGFDRVNQAVDDSRKGIILAWSSDRPGGFSDGDIAALKKIQRRFATACKTAIQTRIANNVTQTYLGRHAGKQVLDGAIKLGDGQYVRAIVWYCDMRNSTSLADTMKPEALLDLLNDYFECTAGPAIEFGGEVLDFIGDAVLAIFPYEDDTGKAQAIRMSTMALEASSKQTLETNAKRKADGKVEFRFGVGIASGEVMYGNIGVANRLAFTAIGPVVNEVERIETMTKSIDASALVTAEIAAVEPERWRSVGEHRLVGFAQSCELFALRESEKAAVSIPKITAKEERKSKKAAAH